MLIISFVVSDILKEYLQEATTAFRDGKCGTARCAFIAITIPVNPGPSLGSVQIRPVLIRPSYSHSAPSSLQRMSTTITPYSNPDAALNERNVQARPSSHFARRGELMRTSSPPTPSPSTCAATNVVEEVAPTSDGNGIANSTVGVSPAAHEGSERRLLVRSIGRHRQSGADRKRRVIFIVRFEIFYSKRLLRFSHTTDGRSHICRSQLSFFDLWVSARSTALPILTGDTSLEQPLIVPDDATRKGPGNATPRAGESSKALAEWYVLIAIWCWSLSLFLSLGATAWSALAPTYDGDTQNRTNVVSILSCVETQFIVRHVSRLMPATLYLSVLLFLIGLSTFLLARSKSLAVVCFTIIGLVLFITTAWMIAAALSLHSARHDPDDDSGDNTEFENIPQERIAGFATRWISPEEDGTRSDLPHGPGVNSTGGRSYSHNSSAIRMDGGMLLLWYNKISRLS